MLTLILLLMGLVVGIFSGLMGIGGGLLIIPAMLYVYPAFLPPGEVAMGIKLITGIAGVQSLAGGFAAALTHRLKDKTNLHLPLIGILGVTTMVGAYLGSLMTGFFADLALKLLYIALLFITLIISVLYRKKPGLTASGAARQVRIGPRIIGPGLIIGYMSGLLGIGGAILLIPLLHNLLRLPLYMSVATSAGIVFLTSIMTVVGKAQAGLIPMPHSVLIALGALAGGYLGARLAHRLPERFLKGLFYVIVGGTLLRLLREFF